MDVYWPIMISRYRSIFVFCFVSLVSIEAACQEYSIIKPFDTAQSRNNLRICMGDDLTQNFDGLKRIYNIKYEMKKLSDCPTEMVCRDNLQWVKFTNTVEIDVPELSEESILKSFKSYEKKSGCDRTTMTKYKYRGSNSKISYTIKLSGLAKLNGILTNFKRKLRRNVKAPPTFRALEAVDKSNITTIKRVVSDFTEPKVLYKTAEDESGFVFDDGVKVQIVRIGFKGSSDAGLLLRHFDKEFVRQLEFFESLSRVENVTHQVEEGDTLWDIAKNYYGDGKFFLYLLEKNKHLDQNLLSLGDQVEVPRWKELCEDINTNLNLVSRGDSLWNMISNDRIDRMPDISKLRSGNKSIIYPLEIITIEHDEESE